MSSARRPGRQGRTAAAGKAGPAAGRAGDGGRLHENPQQCGRERARSCRGKKRAGGCRNARGRMRKIQAGRRSVFGGAAMRTRSWPSRERRLGDPATRRPGDPATRRPGDPATRRPGDPATRRPGDPATRRPGDPATRHYTKGSPLSPCQPLRETFLRAPGDGRKRCAQRADRVSSFVEDGHRDLSEPVARLAGAHSAQICRASPVPFGVPYAEPGGKAIARARLRDTTRGSPVTGDNDASRATVRSDARHTVRTSRQRRSLRAWTGACSRDRRPPHLPKHCDPGIRSNATAASPWKTPLRTSPTSWLNAAFSSTGWRPLRGYTPAASMMPVLSCLRLATMGYALSPYGPMYAPKTPLEKRVYHSVLRRIAS